MKIYYYCYIVIAITTLPLISSDPFQAIIQELHQKKANTLVIQAPLPNKSQVLVKFDNQDEQSTTQPRTKFLSLLPYIQNKSDRSAIQDVLEGKKPQQIVTISHTHIFTIIGPTCYSYQHSCPPSYS